MAENTTNSVENTGLADDLEVLQKIKPFISHCLTLNHDLNNPLAGIIGYGEFLLSEGENLTEDQIEYLNRILSCADRMRKLIEKLCVEKGELAKVVDLRDLSERYK